MSSVADRWTMVVEGVPGTKGRPRIGAGGHFFTPTKTTAYEKLVAGVAIVAGLRVGTHPCAVVIRVWLPNLRKKDPDNVAKVVLDGLVKAGPRAIADDSFAIIRSLTVVLAGIDAARPRVEVDVALVEDPA